ncbi:phosphodiester glycosidase family protein [Hymenobacter volaticus]|uniref:Phosphodiester glycosidase family protein n=1 Tax=Hymenobacter volaticus TaxID=2932254 RepID=A0ABY4GG84_9BACT|nr:phosphodiester glycosidase family protein [Hymenobacter volaticus]UOQ69888.1 phosphodiester glycosidase family protein [Hymenobacter volaticus]
MKGFPTALVLFLLSLLGCRSHSAQPARVEQRTTATGQQYTLFHPDHLALQVVTRLPSLDQRECQLSVAAAYTDLQTNQPLDLLVDQGQLRQAQATVGWLDGVLTIVDTTLTLTRIAPGQTPPSAELEQVRRQKGTVLLQELLVYQGQNLKPAGGSLFQRRALVEFRDHRFAVIESVSDSLTMHQFGEDLRALGARNALYLDMGDWDEGWYRKGKSVVKLGYRRTQTARQSNWLVFVEPESAR